MAEKRTGHGRGLGALIPTTGDGVSDRGVDVFFPLARTQAGRDVPGARFQLINPNIVVPNAAQPKLGHGAAQRV